jgi:Carboxypeptidase regulatory-like domain/Putative Flp pilus-assembly TadE/G-like
VNRSSRTPLGAAREREGGQILIMFAFVLIALLLVSALAVDYGGWLLARRTYQNAADEAAIAGAYLLTSQISDQCTPSQPSKNHCAREAAWTSLQQHLNLTLGGATPAVMADSIGDVPYTEAGYTIWVASPPSDAGAAYPGFASSQKTIFVRVDRHQTANLSRIIGANPTIGAWATAGRIPQNFAIVTLCGPPSCRTPNGEDLKVNGTGSTLIVLRGDIGSNSFAKTSGNDAAIALSDTNASSAYMHYPAECEVGSVSCQLVGWNDLTPGSRTGPKSALALPQVIDPSYLQPTISSTTVPYQCYSVTSTPPAISAVSEPLAEGPSINGAPIDLTSAVQPAPDPAVTLGAQPVKIKGTVTAVVGGAGLTGMTVTATGPGGPLTATSGAGGAFTLNGATQSSSYSLVATDAAGVYHASAAVVVPTGSSDVTGVSLKMSKNPSFTGTVRDSLTLAPLTGATVTFTGTGGPYTATTNASGVYTIYIGNAATAYTATGSMANYASQAYSVTSGALDSAAQTLNFTLNPNNGTIQGTVTSGGVGLVGATVTAGALSTTTGAGGAYSIGVAPGTYAMTASMTGYSSASATVTVAAGATVTQNFSLTAANASITGTVQDQANGLPLPGVTVSATNGVTSGTATTNASGVYTMSGLSPSNPRYDMTASLSGYDDEARTNLNIGSGSNTVDFLASADHGLWPTHCGDGKHGTRKGEWSCADGTGGCPAVLDPTGSNVRCAGYNNTNVIRPGTYARIDIAAGQCAWIDPLGTPTGLVPNAKPGLIHVTGSINIDNGGFLFGDGVTILLDPTASFNVNNSGGFVLNYEDVTGTTYGSGASKFRTESYINRGAGVTRCAGDIDNYTNLKRSAWTTKARYTWDTSVSPPCYRDDGGAGYLGEIGIAFYLRGTPTSSNSHRFDLSGQMGFLFDGVLYGPKDNIGLGGQGAQAAAGQIVAWTLTYSGDTDIVQRYDGLEIDGPPYIIEPYLGE